ncbi:MAG: hypothetical protein ACI9LX_000164 [Paraglaciecola sp.]|jgi:hypothetical protein
MLSFIAFLNIEYLKDSSTSIKRLGLENLAEQFSSSESNPHWRWQDEDDL